MSRWGHCRPFERADGHGLGSGVGLVVPAGGRHRRRRPIHAVIRGSAINNDGSAKMGYVAPNLAAQADVIAEAHAVSGIDLSTRAGVECHGTAPASVILSKSRACELGVRGVADEPFGPCTLGSVKSNIGHLEVAAGTRV